MEVYMPFAKFPNRSRNFGRSAENEAATPKSADHAANVLDLVGE
jgi:hypothetical protein